MTNTWLNNITNFFAPIGSAISQGMNYLTLGLIGQQKESLTNLNKNSGENLDNIFMGYEKDPIIPDIGNITPRYQLKPTGHDIVIEDLKNMVGHLKKNNIETSPSSDFKSLMAKI